MAGSTAVDIIIAGTRYAGGDGKAPNRRDLARRLMNYSTGGFETSSVMGSGGAGVVPGSTKGPSIISRVFDILSRGNYMSANIAEQLAGFEKEKDQNILEAAWEGLSGKDKKTYADVILQDMERKGITPNKKAVGASGLILDIGLDPSTYVGLGFLGQIGKKLGIIGEKTADVINAAPSPAGAGPSPTAGTTAGGPIPGGGAGGYGAPRTFGAPGGTTPRPTPTAPIPNQPVFSAGTTGPATATVNTPPPTGAFSNLPGPTPKGPFVGTTRAEQRAQSAAGRARDEQLWFEGVREGGGVPVQPLSGFGKGPVKSTKQPSWKPGERYEETIPDEFARAMPGQETTQGLDPVLAEAIRRSAVAKSEAERAARAAAQGAPAELPGVGGMPTTLGELGPINRMMQERLGLPPKILPAAEGHEIVPGLEAVLKGRNPIIKTIVSVNRNVPASEVPKVQALREIYKKFAVSPGLIGEKLRQVGFTPDQVAAATGARNPEGALDRIYGANSQRRVRMPDKVVLEGMQKFLTDEEKVLFNQFANQGKEADLRKLMLDAVKRGPVERVEANIDNAASKIDEANAAPDVSPENVPRLPGGGSRNLERAAQAEAAAREAAKAGPDLSPSAQAAQLEHAIVDDVVADRLKFINEAKSSANKNHPFYNPPKQANAVNQIFSKIRYVSEVATGMARTDKLKSAQINYLAKIIANIKEVERRVALEGYPPIGGITGGTLLRASDVIIKTTSALAAKHPSLEMDDIAGMVRQFFSKEENIAEELTLPRIMSDIMKHHFAKPGEAIKYETPADSTIGTFIREGQFEDLINNSVSQEIAIGKKAADGAAESVARTAATDNAVAATVAAENMPKAAEQAAGAVGGTNAAKLAREEAQKLLDEAKAAETPSQQTSARHAQQNAADDVAEAAGKGPKSKAAKKKKNKKKNLRDAAAATAAKADNLGVTPDDINKANVTNPDNTLTPASIQERWESWFAGPAEAVEQAPINPPGTVPPGSIIPDPIPDLPPVTPSPNGIPTPGGAAPTPSPNGIPTPNGAAPTPSPATPSPGGIPGGGTPPPGGGGPPITPPPGGAPPPPTSPVTPTAPPPTPPLQNPVVGGKYFTGMFAKMRNQARQRSLVAAQRSSLQSRTIRLTRTLNNIAKTYKPSEIKEGFLIAQGKLAAVPGSNAEKISKEIQTYFETMFGSIRFQDDIHIAAKGITVHKSGLTIDEANAWTKFFGLKDFQFVKEVLDPNTGQMIPLTNFWHTWQHIDPLKYADDELEFISRLDAAMSNSLMKKATYEDLISQFGRGTPHPGWKEYNGPEPRLQGVHFPEEVLDALHGTVKYINDFEKGGPKGWADFDRALAAWKGTVTVLFPSHHARNMMGDTYLAWTGGMNIANTRTWNQALEVMLERKGMYKDLQDVETALLGPVKSVQPGAVGKSTKFITSKGGERITYDQLYMSAQQYGILPPGNILEDLPLTGLEPSVWDKVPRPIRAPFKGKALEKGRKVSEGREHYVRMAHYIDYIKTHDGPMAQVMRDAQNHVRKHHPDGSELTGFERKVMRRMIPFYSWQRKAIPLLIEGTLRNPGKAAVYPKLMQNLQVAFGVDSPSIADPFPEDQRFPDWIRDQGVGPMFGKAGGYFGIGAGLNPLMEVVQDYQHPWSGVASQINPAISTPFELATGRKFSNPDIREEDVSRRIDTAIPQLAAYNRVANQNIGAGAIEAALSNNPDAIKGKYASEGFNPWALVNMATGAGIQNMSRENYINQARIQEQLRKTEAKKRRIEAWHKEQGG